MNERKNIEHLFQDKFTNFEVEPNEIAWENIKEKLQEKKKRRVIPFWFKFSGVAALLAVGIVFFNSDFKSNDVKNTNPVVNQSKDVDEKLDEKNSISDKNKPIKSVANSENELNKNKNSNLNSKNILNENTDIEKENLNRINASNNQISNINSKSNSLENKKDLKSKVIKNRKSSSEISNKNDDRIAQKSSKSENNTKSNLFNSSSEKLNSTNLNNDKNLINKNLEDKSIVNQTQNKDTKTFNLNSKETVVEKSNPISNEFTNKIDSTKIAIVEPNMLEELLKEKEAKLNEEPKINRWQVVTNVAPIYFSSTRNGSPLDSKLASNDKNYAGNFSYGVGVNYAVNKKLKIRTGLNRLAVDYDTNGIVYYENSATVSGKIANLNPNVPGSLITIESLSNVDSPFNKVAQINKNEGSLNQKMGYIEFPLELSYRLVDKKFGLDFIGGMSTLYLNQNEIYLQSDKMNMKIGEANNLSTLHFSTNLGLGFKYNFLKNFNAHLEPVFKYQLNTFTNNVGDFKPYVFGVYSGISYSF